MLSLLCSPRIYSSRLVEFGKLNKQRAARGKWPLMAYREVSVRLSDPHSCPDVVRATGEGAPKPLHFVRAHLRLRSSGRIEVVRPHWRGDAQLGIKRPTYRLVP